MSGAFIDLHRRFYELRASDAALKQLDDAQLVRSGKSLGWDDVLAESRVVILAEAGAGKTEEIREIAKRLHTLGKPAFFLRLEHVAADGLDVAFEEGDADSFKKWLQSSAEGWLLLDSIDESKLRHPSDFALAIKRVGIALGAAKHRCHIVVTGRTPAWRPSSDKSSCESALPMRPVGGRPGPSKHPDGEASQKDANAGGFVVLAMEDLSPAQVRTYVTAKGLADPDKFITALERDDAWPHAARPLDLDELLEFWSEFGRIGTRYELTRSSIERRLKERDPDRGQLSALTVDRAREGAMQVAAACTLSGQSAIKVPDARDGSAGLSIEDLLTNWTEHDCMSLLSRPIFDEAIYGCVRIAHRSFREYLTAEWFARLLKASTSRRAIEQLFVREQYGVAVVVPSRRPILPWLAIVDPKIADRLMQIAPEVLLEGGDPRELPLPARQQLLEECCDRLARGEATLSSFALDSIERFAAPDIAADVKRLLSVYSDNRELVVFLLRMVWRGQLTAAVPDALQIAIDPSADHHARVIAIRVVSEMGGDEDRRAVRAAFLTEPAPQDREIVSELVQGGEASAETFEWLASCLPKLAPPKRYAVDHLESSVQTLVARAGIELLPPFVVIADNFLSKPPYIEHQSFPVSTDYRWLVHAAGFAIERLIAARDLATLAEPSLMLLQRLGAIFASHDHSEKSDLPKAVRGWKELNYCLFWKLVDHARASALARGEAIPANWWSYGMYESFVKFEPEDFQLILNQRRARPTEADRRVALSLAFRLYLERGRNPKDRQALWDAVADSEELRADLYAFMHPRVSPQEAKMRRINREYAKRSKERHQKEKRNFEKSREYLQKHVETLRDSPLAGRGDVSQAQAYLLDRAQAAEKNGRYWSSGDWRVLIDPFGEEVATAFRDGSVAFWRNYRPLLRSEGAVANSTPLSVVFGLYGLAIESAEHRDWVASLLPADAEIAVRYAIHELNGFPPWLPSLFRRFPEAVHGLFAREIEFELKNEVPTNEPPSTYVLYDVSWSGEWIRDLIAPRLYDLVQLREPQHSQNLEYILTILQASSLPDSALADLAHEKTTNLQDFKRAAHWAAVWLGVDAPIALEWIVAKLMELDAVQALEFCMIFLVDLVGSRDTRLRSRRSFATPTLLKQIYLLAHQYVSTAADVDRADSGVYSPGLRDHAQEARETLLELLFAIEGKEAFVAFNELSESHPNQDWRPWLRVRARKKAEIDANDSNWTVAQVRDFFCERQKTPSTPRDVFDIARGRMLDFRDDVENGDTSQASVLIAITKETLVRNFIAGWARDRAAGRYSLAQEDELADAKRPDIRWYAPGIDAPVPVELKLADNWSGPKLVERLENQLCGDYVRDFRTRFGLFVLVWRGQQSSWEVPGVAGRVDFAGLISALEARWRAISATRPQVDEIAVIGIDLTKRAQPPS